MKLRNYTVKSLCTILLLIHVCQLDASAAEGRPSWIKTFVVGWLLFTQGISQPLEPQPLGQSDQFFSPTICLDPSELGTSETSKQPIQEPPEHEQQDDAYKHAENKCYTLLLKDTLDALQDPAQEPSYNPGDNKLTQSLVIHKNPHKEFFASPYTIILSTPSEIPGSIRVTQLIRKHAQNLVDYVACRQTLIARRSDDTTAVTTGDGSNYAFLKQDNQDRLVRVGYYFRVQDEFHSFDGAQFSADYLRTEIAKKQRQAYAALEQQKGHLKILDGFLKNWSSYNLSSEVNIGRASFEWDCRSLLLHDAFTALQKSDTAPDYSRGWWPFYDSSLSCKLGQPEALPYHIKFTRPFENDTIRITQSVTQGVGEFVRAHQCRSVLFHWRRQGTDKADSAKTGTDSSDSLVRTGYALTPDGIIRSLVFEADFSQHEIEKMKNKIDEHLTKKLKYIAYIDPLLNKD